MWFLDVKPMQRLEQRLERGVDEEELSGGVGHEPSRE